METRQDHVPLTRSEADQSLFTRGVNVKELVELRDGEDFENLWPDVAEPEFAFGGLRLFLHVDELPKRGTRQVFDVCEVEDDLFAAIFVDETGHLIPDDLNVCLVENLLVDEFGDCHSANIFNIQSSGPVSHVATFNRRGF